MARPPTAYVPTQDKDLVQGLKRLRRASLLNVVSSLTMGIGLITLLVASFGFGASRPSADGFKILASTLIGLTAALAVLIVGGILALVATYAYLLPAFSSLKKYDSLSFSTPASLIKIGYLGGLLAVVTGVFAIIAGTAASIATVLQGSFAALGLIVIGIVIAIIGFIMFIVGEIGLIVGLFKLNDRFRDSTFLAAAIMFIVGFFVIITTFVGWILVYVASGAALNRIARGEAPQYPPPPPPQVV